MKPLLASHKYSSFMQGRDHVLESLLQKYLRHMGGVLSVLEKKAREIALQINVQTMTHYDFKRNRDRFANQLHPWFEMAGAEITTLIIRLRRSSYVLSYAGQAEGIARVTGKAHLYKINHLDQISHSDTPSGGKLHLRVELILRRIFNDVVDAYQLSQVMASDDLGESQKDMLARISRAFPTKKKDSKPRKLLARLKESDRPGLNDSFLSFGVIEPDEWNQILEDYFSEEFPQGSANRTIFSNVFYSDAPEDEGRYEWEIEKEVSQDFVQQVRDGENDAATAQGITDFQWVSIIDNKTDACCEWRDGLSSKEIEEALDNEHSDDECDATTPPAHFFCRCRLVPMTAELNESPTSGLMDFETWLNTK